MKWTRPARPNRPPLSRALAALAAVAALSACSSAGEDPAGLDDTATAEPTSDPSPAATGEDAEAAILDVYQRYWDARIASTNGPDSDAALFAGIAYESVIAQHVAAATTYEDEGIVFTGEPRVYDTAVEIDGDTAQVTSCVDDSEWVGTQDGEPLPPNPDKPTVYPVVFEVYLLDGAWLIGNSIEPEGEISC